MARNEFDGLFNELRETNMLLDSINPSLSLHKRLTERKQELLEKIKAYQQKHEKKNPPTI